MFWLTTNNSFFRRKKPTKKGIKNLLTKNSNIKFKHYTKSYVKRIIEKTNLKTKLSITKFNVWDNSFLQKQKITSKVFLKRIKHFRRPSRNSRLKRFLYDSNSKYGFSLSFLLKNKKIINKRFKIKPKGKKTLLNKKFTYKSNIYNSILIPSETFFAWIKIKEKKFTLLSKKPFISNKFYLKQGENFCTLFFFSKSSNLKYLTNNLIYFLQTWSFSKHNFLKYISTFFNNLFNKSLILYKTNFFSDFRKKIFNQSNRKLILRKNFSSEKYKNSIPKNKFNKTLNLFFKTLPHFKLIGLNRKLRGSKSKIWLYNIPKNRFFDQQLIRIDDNYPKQTPSTIKLFRKDISKNNFKGINFLLNFTRNDNFIENSFDKKELKVFKSNLSENLINSFLSKSGRLTRVSSQDSVIKNVNKNVNKNVDKNKDLINLNIHSPAMLDKNSIILKDLNNINLYFKSPLFYKYLLFKSFKSCVYSPVKNKHNFDNLLLDFNKNFFNSRINLFTKSNILPSSLFKYTYKRRILKVLNFYKFSSNTVMWYYNMLIRFIENCSGKKVYMKFNPFVENSLSFSDLARCDLWYSRITGFQRILGPRIFLKESLKILFVAFKYKDPTFLANWIKGMLARMSFWKYKLLFRYLKYVMRYLFWFQFENLKFKGLKLRLKGKISVAGNARTRTLVYAIGETSFSKINNKVVSDYSTINTFTGVLGFKVWFFF